LKQVNQQSQSVKATKKTEEKSSMAAYEFSTEKYESKMLKASF